MGTFDDTEARQRLSALADGELGGSDTALACASWRSDAVARRDWHAWHLIGDVLRSEDLASDPRGDLRFCAAVRARLAAEPGVLAPVARLAASGTPSRIRSGWMFASAAAAGFVLVAGTFALVRTTDTPAPAVLARADGRTANVLTTPASVAKAAAEAGVPPDAVVADNRMIRDAQLDRYLVAHKQFAGTSALGVPSVFLRSATVDLASR